MGIRDWWYRITHRNKELPEGRGEVEIPERKDGHKEFQTEMQGMAKLSPEEIAVKRQEQERTDDLQFAYRHLVKALLIYMILNNFSWEARKIRDTNL